MLKRTRPEENFENFENSEMLEVSETGSKKLKKTEDPDFINFEESYKKYSSCYYMAESDFVNNYVINEIIRTYSHMPIISNLKEFYMYKWQIQYNTDSVHHKCAKEFFVHYDHYVMLKITYLSIQREIHLLQTRINSINEQLAEFEKE